MDNEELVKRLSSLQEDYTFLYLNHGLVSVSMHCVHIDPELFDELKAQGLITVTSKVEKKEFLHVKGVFKNRIEAIALKDLNEEDLK